MFSAVFLKIFVAFFACLFLCLFVGIDLKGLPENKDLGDKFDVEAAKKEYISKREPYSLKGDFLNVKEISDACLYITSDAASGTTGHAFRCEGGLIYHL